MVGQRLVWLEMREGSVHVGTISMGRFVEGGEIREESGDFRIGLDAGKKEGWKRRQHHRLAAMASPNELELAEKGRSAQSGGMEVERMVVNWRDAAAGRYKAGDHNGALQKGKTITLNSAEIKIVRTKAKTPGWEFSLEAINYLIELLLQPVPWNYPRPTGGHRLVPTKRTK